MRYFFSCFDHFQGSVPNGFRTVFLPKLYIEIPIGELPTEQARLPRLVRYPGHNLSFSQCWL
jgi:hypothetical protein